MNTRISAALIIPTFNRRDFVLEAVSSVLKGTVVPAVIVVDDGSTDGTAEALRARFADQVTVVEQKNAERGAARNHGVRLAGPVDLILFLDADDLLHAGHVASLVQLAERHPQVGLFHTPFEEVDEEGTPQGRGGGGEGTHSWADFVLARVQIPPSVLAIRNALFERVGGFDERRDLAGSEDWLMVANALRVGPSLCTATPTVMMRKHAGNSMGNAAAMESSMLLAHALHFDSLSTAGGEGSESKDDVAVLRSRSRAKLLVNAATTWFAAGQAEEARRCLRAAVSEWPAVIGDVRVPTTFLKTILGTDRIDQLKSWLRP